VVLDRASLPSGLGNTPKRCIKATFLKATFVGHQNISCGTFKCTLIDLASRLKLAIYMLQRFSKII